jgi:nitroreductase
MSGIIFNKTAKLKQVVSFYQEVLNAEVWLDQGHCVILRHGNQLFGFCSSDQPETSGTLTFFYAHENQVDDIYQRLEESALDTPKVNPRFKIYHFYAKDPEDRSIEIQSFLHRLRPYWSGEELLIKRRSIRKYLNEDVPDKLLAEMMELCRFAPTSRNSESYYYVVTKDPQKIERLSEVREGASKPLANAPVLVAVCANPGKTKRVIQDACIAAYHFLLAATQFGLGTCWITDMDRTEVKELLAIPTEHYVACLTPLGFPDESKDIPERRAVSEIMIKI